QVLGTPDAPCVTPFINQSTPLFANPILNFEGFTFIASTTGTKELFPTGFKLGTESPVWIATELAVTNKVNLLSFEAAFTSKAGAEGLLSVYWGTNVIGSLDERVTVSGLRKYSFPLPAAMTNGVRMLGFRLDPFSQIQSSAIITNMALGFAGIRDPFSLSFTGQLKDGVPILQLIGPRGFTYAVESSTNLVDWKPAAFLINTGGSVRFADPSATGATARFYRAVGP
ncbi:MAG: hypothetical protein HYW65_00715, partial [Candidatus Liptonbacteria bacterium]|nr:hypothetical protein [Candidatus Liptonbacteria bacterium]